MADVTKNLKSHVMARIRKTDTKPELIVRKFLFKNGFRFRIHVKSLMGNPDIVLRKHRALIFVNGCFWHAHKDCKLNRTPKSNTEYWIPKILGNVERDKKNRRALKKLGWNIFVVWECNLNKQKREKTLQKLYKKITGKKLNEIH